MKRITFGLLMLGVTFSIQAEEQTSRANGASFRVGFVDVKKVFDGYEKTRDNEKSINQWFRNEMLLLEKEEDRQKKMAEEIELFAPRSPERQKQEKEYFRQRLMLDLRKKSIQEAVQNRLKTSTEVLYGEVREEIAIYARKMGHHLILKVDTDAITSNSRNELKLKIHTRNVIYYDPKLDVTEAIVKRLNAKYKAGEGSKQPEKSDR